jgi:hypothetical protein
MPEQKAPKAAGKPAMATPKVAWDDAQMSTSYANVVNAASTREEVAIFFGTNQTWNLSKDQEVTVQLTNPNYALPGGLKCDIRFLPR